MTRNLLIGFGILAIVLSIANMISPPVAMGAIFGIVCAVVSLGSIYLTVRTLGFESAQKNGLSLTIMSLMFKLPVLFITGYLASQHGKVGLISYVVTITMVYSVTVWRASQADLFSQTKR